MGTRHHFLTSAAFDPPDGRTSAPAGPDPDTLLSTSEAAKLVGASERWLERHRLAGTGPKFAKLGRLVRYRRADLLGWIAANAHASTSAATVAAQREGRGA